MDLRMETESTLTRHVSRPSEPNSTLPDGDTERLFPPRDELLGEGQTLDIRVPDNPPENLLLDVVMTFADGAVHLGAPGIGVSAEGDSVQAAFGRLVAAAKDYLASAKGEEATLLRYAPDTWFRFVSPDQVRYQSLGGADFWPEGENVEDFIEAATEGRYEEDEPDS